MTLTTCRERKAFGQPIGSFQDNRFTLAELATETDIARVYVDRCIEELNAGDADRGRRREGEVVDHRAAEAGRRPCLQLHGGYGYMTEYPIARAYLDTRVQTIYGGTTEIMKEIIGRTMGV